MFPFVLGAASALSLTWLHGNLSPASNERGRRQVVSSSSSSAVDASKQGGNGDNEDREEIMDAADLDHRMLRKAEAVLQWRTSRLVLVIERCTNDHNYSAILRTAEALGIQTVYMIDPPMIRDEEEDEDLQRLASKAELEARRQHHFFARNALEWLTVVDFSTSKECVESLHQLGYKLWVTDLSQEAECLTMTTPVIPDKVALVMGTEAVGCSQYLLDQADKRVYLPLRGFADSLNLSVATALILHHMFLMDPSLIGAMTPAERLELRKAWYTKLCQQRILTSKQKKDRIRLKEWIKKCETIQERHLKDPTKPLQATEKKRLSGWDSYKKQLEELEALIEPKKVQAAVDDWIQNPPKALTDVRRADDHRVCYVGKNTKKHHQDHWKDMVATSNSQSTHGMTANVFREKLKQQNKLRNQ